jgi:hypothetical protein
MRWVLIGIGAVVLVIGVGMTVLIAFANGMSDAPTEKGTPVWPTISFALLGAGLIAYGVMS